MNKKIPIIGSLVIFILIFLINSILSNSFLVIISRSIISGILTFGIIFGVYYVFKDVLKIDLTMEYKNTGNEEGIGEEENKVDVTVGDEDISEKEESINEEDQFNVLENEESSDLENEEMQNEGINNVEIMEEDTKEDLNISTDFNTDSPVDNIKNLENSEEADFVPDKKNSLNQSSTLKDKIGMEASSEDLAKAIRTKIQRDG